MARRDRRGRPRGRSRGGALFRWGPIVLVLALFAGAAAAYHYDLGTRWFGAAARRRTHRAAGAGAHPAARCRRRERWPGRRPRAARRPLSVRRALGPALRRPRTSRDLRAVVAPLHGSTGPRRRPRHVDAGLDPQAPHRHRRPRDPRPRPHLRDPGRRRRTQPPDPGRRRRPVPDRQAAHGPGGAGCREPPDARRGDGPQPEGPRRHHGLARLRHLAVHRPGAQPALAAELRHRQRGLPDHRPLGRPGHRAGRRESRGRPCRERCRRSSRPSCATSGVHVTATGRRASGAGRLRARWRG